MSENTTNESTTEQAEQEPFTTDGPMPEPEPAQARTMAEAEQIARAEAARLR